MNRYVFIT